MKLKIGGRGDAQKNPTVNGLKTQSIRGNFPN
jgi:hypothetical protein